MLSLLPERRLGNSFNGARIIFILILTSICHLHHKRAAEEKEIGCIIPFVDLVNFLLIQRLVEITTDYVCDVTSVDLIL